MKTDELTIGQVKDLLAMFVTEPTSAPSCTEDHGFKIVVLTNGFVYVGEVETDAKWVYIKNAKNIRRWGTSKGLGELVDGPLEGTILDNAGDIQAALHSLNHFLSVDANSWEQ